MNIENLAAQCNLTVTEDLIQFSKLVIQAYDLEKKSKPKAKPKNTMPENWQGNGKFKVLDRETNTHFITDYEGACIHKGVSVKKAFTVKVDTKDRQKDFTSYDITKHNDVQNYVNAWCKANHLKVATL